MAVSDHVDWLPAVPVEVSLRSSTSVWSLRVWRSVLVVQSVRGIIPRVFIQIELQVRFRTVDRTSGSTSDIACSVLFLLKVEHMGFCSLENTLLQTLWALCVPIWPVNVKLSFRLLWCDSVLVTSCLDKLFSPSACDFTAGLPAFLSSGCFLGLWKGYTREKHLAQVCNSKSLSFVIMIEVSNKLSTLCQTQPVQLVVLQ